MQPLESIHPIIQNPHVNPHKPLVLEIINKVRWMSMGWGYDYAQHMLVDLHLILTSCSTPNSLSWC